VTEGTSTQATVLVVDDEHHLADLYTDYLADDHEVLTAYGGEEALELLDDPDTDVDVTLLDRRMPDLSGDEVLAAIDDTDEEIRVGDEVIFEGPSAISIGRAEMSGPEMQASTRGIASEVRHTEER